MKTATHVARYFLGTAFFVFGLNGFLNFIRVPPVPEPAGAFLGALVHSGYLMTTVKLVEVVTGALLLADLFVPLALVLLAPVVVNIVLFHIFLTPGDVLPYVLGAGVLVFLMWQHRDAYRPLFQRKARPAAQVASAGGVAAPSSENGAAGATARERSDSAVRVAG